MVRLGDILSVITLNKHITDGYISEQKHPTLPLWVLNYTHKTQIERKWDDVTKRCRGLIFTKDSSNRKVIVAHPFVKFFNLGEVLETSAENLAKNYSVTLFEQLDGSMGVIWKHEDTYGVSTRGSFTSPQALWATKWFHDNVVSKQLPHNLDIVNPIVEIIYPKNRIVVEYSYSGLVVLGLTQKDGGECSRNQVKDWARNNNMAVVRSYPRMSVAEALLDNRDNFEGYVGFAHSVYLSPFRFKIKTPNYVRLHKMITGWNPKNVWEWLKDGKDYNELIDPKMPEHFRTWFSKWVMDLTAQYADVEKRAQKLFGDIDTALRKSCGETPTRKDYALAITKYPDLAPVLFLMLDKQEYSEVIWKKLKPESEDKFVDAEPEVETATPVTARPVHADIGLVDALEEDLCDTEGDYDYDEPNPNDD
jgi:RNA ligase